MSEPTTLPTCPGRAAARSDAAQTRDPDYFHSQPGVPDQRYTVPLRYTLHRVRDTDRDSSPCLKACGIEHRRRRCGRRIRRFGQRMLTALDASRDDVRCELERFAEPGLFGERGNLFFIAHLLAPHSGLPLNSASTRHPAVRALARLEGCGVALRGSACGRAPQGDGERVEHDQLTARSGCGAGLCAS